jgi:tetratricopeptide (TPR) repeat protein
VITRNSLHKLNCNIFFGLTLVLFVAVAPSCRGKREAVSAREPVATRVVESEGIKDIKFGYLYYDGCNERMKGNLQQALKLFEDCQKIYPLNAAAAYELGTIYKLLGNHEKAVVNAKLCADAEPKNEWYQELLIQSYKGTKQYKQAIQVRENLVKNFPDRNEFKEDLATEYAATGQYDRSYKLYEQLEKSYGANEQITLNKVKLLKSQNKISEAEQELIKLLKTSPNNITYHAYLAEFYEEQNAIEKAKAVYDNMAKMEPNNPQVNLALSDYYTSKNKPAEAFTYLKKAFESSELDLGIKSNILTEYYNTAERGNATAKTEGLELSGVLMKLYPNATESNGIYADFLRLDNKNKEAAIYYYKAAINEKRNYRIWKNLLFIDNELGYNDSLEHHSAMCMDLFPSLPEGYLFNGVANSQLKNYSKAVVSLKDGLEFVSGNKAYSLDFLRSLGDAYYYVKDYSKSDKAFDEALKLDADNTYVLNNYAYFLSLRNENLDKAEKFSKRANELRPGDLSYMDTYGWILYMQKKFPDAEVWLSKAAAGSPKDPTVLEHYGDVLYRLNKTTEALQQWNLAKNAGAKSEVLLKKIKEKRMND